MDRRLQPASGCAAAGAAGRREGHPRHPEGYEKRKKVRAESGQKISFGQNIKTEGSGSETMILKEIPSDLRGWPLAGPLARKRYCPNQQTAAFSVSGEKKLLKDECYRKDRVISKNAVQTSGLPHTHRAHGIHRHAINIFSRTSP